MMAQRVFDHLRHRAANLIASGNALPEVGERVEAAFKRTPHQIIEDLYDGNRNEARLKMLWMWLDETYGVTISKEERVSGKVDRTSVYVGGIRARDLGAKCVEVLEGWFQERGAEKAQPKEDPMPPTAAGPGDRFILLGTLLNDPNTTLSSVVAAARNCGLRLRFAVSPMSDGDE